ncbi:MAG: glucose-1-phosphate thymidylyltransferase RfbA [Clostridia bacterium]|nr:glucose-1-phosphate thymidylyltransferase RfbA [Clostridia bacterium]
MKGIILAGGKGTRLYPMTQVVSKQLLNVYDKPLIYYPLSTLLLADIKDILIITTSTDVDNYKKLFGNGENLGIKMSYKVQDEPNGIAEAFVIGEDFIGDDNVCLILGDNVFYGGDFVNILQEAKNIKEGGIIFAYPVANPESFGVVEFDETGKAISIEEKPKIPKSKFAVPGLYFYDNEVINIAKNLKKSARGEYEITDVNLEYLRQGKLNVKQLSRGLAWLDTGTPESILKASEFVYTIQARQGQYISCIEEIAWRRGFIDNKKLIEIGNKLKMTDYGKYILSLVGE